MQSPLSTVQPCYSPIVVERRVCTGTAPPHGCFEPFLMIAALQKYCGEGVERAFAAGSINIRLAERFQRIDAIFA